MDNMPYILLTRPGRIFEASGTDWYRFITAPQDGEVRAQNRQLAELSVHAFFVLPPPGPSRGRSPSEPHVNILTLGRNRQAASPPGEDGSDILVIVSHNAAESRFEVRVKVGEDTSPPGVLTTGDASYDAVCGRVFQLYVEVSAGRLFASVNEGCFGADGLFDVVGPIPDGDELAWGGSPCGHWRIATGLLKVAGLRFSSLPPGFGLSDLRIELGAEEDDEPMPPAYSGELNHLVCEARVPAVAPPVDPVDIDPGSFDRRSFDLAEFPDADFFDPGFFNSDPDSFDPDTFDPPLFEEYLPDFQSPELR